MSSNAMSFDSVVTRLESNTICYVYPNGEVIVTQKLTAQERALRSELSQVSHNYSAIQKLNRYKHKIQQQLDYNQAGSAA